MKINTKLFTALCTAYTLYALPVLGITMMQDSIKAKNLPDAVVKAKRHLIKYKDGRMIYQVSKDPDAKNLDLMQVLKKMPIIEVSDDRELRIAGSAKIKVLLNGKEYVVISKNISEILKSISADDLEQYEVKTEPSAKYLNEGYTAVLNIVTKSGRAFKGYTTSLSGNVDNRGTNRASAFGTIQLEKLIMSADIRENNAWNTPKSSVRQITNNYTSNDTRTTFTQSNDVFRERSWSYGASFMASYELDKNNLFNLESYYNTNRRKNNRLLSTSTDNIQETLVYGYDQLTNSRNGKDDFKINFNYQHFFGTPERVLTLSYAYDKAKQISTQRNCFFNLINEDSIAKYLGVINNNIYDMPRSTPVHTTQMDYMFNGKHSLLNFGIKYIDRNKESNYEVLNSFPEVQSPQTHSSSSIVHKERVCLVYGEYGYRFSKIEIKGRLNYDYNYGDLNYKEQPAMDFSRTSHLLNPHLALSWQIKQNLRFIIEGGYKTYRPEISFLNPFVEEYPQSKKYGNPNLHNEKVFSGASMLQYYTQKIFTMLNLNVYKTNNSIEEYSWLDENGIKNTTYDNIGRLTGFGLSNYTRCPLWKGSYVAINPYLIYNHYQCDMLSINRDIVTFQYNVSLQQRLPLDISFEAYLNGNTRTITMGNTQYGSMNHSIAFSKSFLKNGVLQLRLAATNPFKTHQTDIVKSYMPTYASDSYSTRTIRSVSIELRLQVGKLRSNVKKTNKSISNNDVKILNE